MNANFEHILSQIDNLQREINKYRPLDKVLSCQIKEYFRIGLTYTSNALEGNSLTESETKIVLEEGITIGGKPLKDHLEAVGHSEAFYKMYDLSSKQDFSEHDIRLLHKLFYHHINDACAGVYRDKQAFITGSKYPLPLPTDIPKLMQHFVEESASQRKQLHPIEAVALIHKNFVFMHPFVDGNGRVARLLMNLILLQEGYTITVIPPIVRKDYIAALEKAHVDDFDFKVFIATMVKETQRDYLRLFARETL